MRRLKLRKEKRVDKSIKAEKLDTDFIYYDQLEKGYNHISGLTNSEYKELKEFFKTPRRTKTYIVWFNDKPWKDAFIVPFNKKGQILTVDIKYNQKHVVYDWFFGGMVDYDDNTPFETAIRELREETFNESRKTIYDKLLTDFDFSTSFTSTKDSSKKTYVIYFEYNDEFEIFFEEYMNNGSDEDVINYHWKYPSDINTKWFELKNEIENSIC